MKLEKVCRRDKRDVIIGMPNDVDCGLVDNQQLKAIGNDTQREKALAFWGQFDT